MNSKLFLFFCLCFIAFSCQKDDDDTTGGETPVPVLGSALFTVVNCTDTAVDPTCSESFDLMPGAKVYLYTSELNRELNNPIYSQKLTNGEGIADMSALESNNYFYTVEYPLNTTVVKQDAFSIANGLRAQIRVEFEEE